MSNSKKELKSFSEDALIQDGWTCEHNADGGDNCLPGVYTVWHPPMTIEEKIDIVLIFCGVILVGVLIYLTLSGAFSKPIL